MRRLLEGGAYNEFSILHATAYSSAALIQIITVCTKESECFADQLRTCLKVSRVTSPAFSHKCLRSFFITFALYILYLLFTVDLSFEWFVAGSFVCDRQSGVDVVVLEVRPIIITIIIIINIFIVDNLQQ